VIYPKVDNCSFSGLVCNEMQVERMTGRAEQERSLIHMCLLALAVGVIADGGAWVFRRLIGLFHNIFFIGHFSFTYDANMHTLVNPWGPWIILAPVIGSVFVAWLVSTFAPEAKGHGVPEVMDAIYYNDARIRPIVAVVKSLASALTIGSGGWVGREGPIVQIGAAFGSALGQLLRLPARQCVTLVAAGAGAGIAATFNAPLGGVIFAIELLLISINARTVLPLSLATAVATHIGRALLGANPAFDFPPLQVEKYVLFSPLYLMLFIPLGIAAGSIGALFVQGIYWVEDKFEALPGNYYTRHMSGMLLVGIVICLLKWRTGYYYVEGVGYATIMDLLRGMLTDPWLLCLLLLLKLLATCLTLGSGGSGGVFSPALFLGAILGALFNHGCHSVFSTSNIDPNYFIVAGMAAMVGNTTGAVVTAAVMLMEMTGESYVVLPIIITTATAYGVRVFLSPASIYTLKLLRRGHAVPEGLQSALLAAYQIKHVKSDKFRVVEGDETLSAFDGVTVVVQKDEIAGVIGPIDHEHRGDVEIEKVDMEDYLVVQGEMSLIEVIRKMNAKAIHYAVVTSRPGSRHMEDVIGIITERELAGAMYKAAQLL
jgi:CIC family chloride channel protein